MFTTLVIWQQKLTDEVKNALHQRALEIQEDSNSTVQWGGLPDEGPWETRRFWDTRENAQAWIDAVTPYNPVSAVIENE